MVTLKERNLVAALKVGMISPMEFLGVFYDDYGDNAYEMIEFVLNELGLKSKNLTDC